VFGLIKKKTAPPADTPGEENKPARKKVELVPFDSLEIGETYEIAGFVKCYPSPIFDASGEDVLQVIAGAEQFKGRFKVEDIDGGVEDVSIWYQVEVIRAISKTGVLKKNVSVWVNSLSFKKVKTRQVKTV